MLSASFNLIYDGQAFGPAPLVTGLFLGAGFIWMAKRILMDSDEILGTIDSKDLDAKKAFIIVMIMTLHAVGEGSGVGVRHAPKFPEPLLWLSKYLSDLQQRSCWNSLPHSSMGSVGFVWL
jgi:hypothetical protein